MISWRVAPAEMSWSAALGTPTSRFHTGSLVGYFRDLGETAAVQKDHTATAEVAGKLAQVRPDVAGDAELAAQFFGRCVTLAIQDTVLSEIDRQTLANSYADQAIEHLREAVRLGYKNAAALKSQVALTPLKGRTDFQQLVQELESR